MDHATLVILQIAVGITALGLIAGYAVYAIKRPKSWFRVWTSDGGELAYKMKKLGSTFTWIDPKDKRKVVFPLDVNFARRAKNGGLRFIGDAKTGALQRWDANPNAWQYMDPKYGPTALNDGRVLQIAKAMKGPAPWEQYILPGLVVIGLVVVATLFFVYKIYSNAQGGGA